MAAYLSPVFGAGAQLFNNQGIPLSGGKINTYLAGTTTPLATWTDSTQIITNANPIILDSAGRPLNEIWLQASTLYKFILTDANDNILGTWDNIAGLNDITSSVTVTEWVATNLAPAFISTTSFSVPGNNTATFPLNRRVKLAVSAGTTYGYVVSSSFGGGITTVVILPDSTVLDLGVSAVSVGLLSSINPSYPQQLLAMNASATIASAPTVAIGAALSANIIISGVVTITAFDTVPAGILRFVKFTDILTLTHNGTSLILPGAANITTANGDQAVFRSLGSGNWECINYQIASFAPSHVALADLATNATSATNQSGGTVSATTIASASSYSLAGHLLSSSTPPTISSGFGTSPSIVGTTAGFNITVGSGGIATAGTINLPTPNAAWVCVVTPTSFATNQSLVAQQLSATQISITSFNISSGLGLAFPAGQILSVVCMAR